MNKEELSKKVFEALGEVSMCWAKGIFNDEEGRRIGEELIDYIIRIESSEPKRLTGYYWVNYQGERRIAEYFHISESWYIIGLEESLEESELDFIDETPITYK